MPKQSAPTAVQTAGTTSKELMGIQELLKATWEHLKLVWKKLLLISVLVMALMFGLTLVVSLVVGVFGVAMVAGAIGGSFSLAAMLPVILVVLMGVIGGIIITSAFQAGMLLVVAEPESTDSAWAMAKRGFAFAVPIIVANIVVSLLVLGGMALFIVPGLVIAILLSFVLYEIVLHKQSLGSAFANSATIIKQNFSAVFMRWLAMVGVAFLFGLALAVLGAIPGINVLLGLLNPVLSAVLSWLVLIYWFLVYKQTRERTNFSQTASVTWMYVVGAIGWVVMVVMIMSVGSLLTTALSALNDNEYRGSTQYNDMLEEVDSEALFNDMLLEESLTEEDRQQIEDIKKMMESGDFPVAE